jgi:hypothetical protein
MVDHMEREWRLLKMVAHTKDTSKMGSNIVLKTDL